MAVYNGYVTTAGFISRMNLQSITTASAEVPIIEAVINSVSRQIDRYCGRKFYMTSASEVRYYTPDEHYTLYVDDLLSVSTIASDENGERSWGSVWSTGDYDLMPFNAALEDRPYTWIETTPNGSYTFPAGVTKAVKITGNWGYCTYATGAPYEVQEACYIQCSRIWKRKDSPFGISGVSELGILQMVPKMDVDVKALLDPYRKLF